MAGELKPVRPPGRRAREALCTWCQGMPHAREWEARDFDAAVLAWDAARARAAIVGWRALEGLLMVALSLAAPCLQGAGIDARPWRAEDVGALVERFVEEMSGRREAAPCWRALALVACRIIADECAGI